jgi:hypothetical protein
MNFLPDRLQAAADHAPGHGVDGGLPHLERQARFGHPAHAVAGVEDHLFAVAGRRPQPDPGPDLGAVGHVRVVAGVLDDRGEALAALPAMAVQRNDEAATAGKRHRKSCRAGQTQKLQERPPGCGRRGGAGGEAYPELQAGARRPGRLLLF